MDNSFDAIIVGGGILGTFHAYHALDLGLRVCLLEKDLTPQGATTRNFGQVVPSGMDHKWQEFGRESLRIYKEIQARFDIGAREQGSVYLASDGEEEQLLLELREMNREQDYPSRMLTKAQCLERYPGLRADYVRAGLFFPGEMTVEPRTTVQRLHQYLREQKGLYLRTGVAVVSCEREGEWIRVRSSANEELLGKKVIICNGSEFKLLYPGLFAESDLEVTKLQMMQTVPQKNYHLPGSILSGWSIRRYEAFRQCPSYAQIKAREEVDSPQRKWGVHILFKQALDGSMILGDSHQYADVDRMGELGYDLDMDIDRFMVEQAKSIIQLPSYAIQKRWYGLYSQCKGTDLYQKTVEGDIHIVTGIGGKGMTGAPGYSKYNTARIFNLDN